MMRIALLAALPEEYGPFKRLFGPWRMLQRRPFRVLCRREEDRELVLIETGIGMASVLAALEWATNQGRPDLAVSFGFAGSLHEDLVVGDVCLGTSSVHLEQKLDCHSGESFQFSHPRVLSRFSLENGVREARIVTVDRLESKKSLGQSFEDTPSVVDMETFYVARWAAEMGVPLLCLRSISDGLHDELDFDLDALSDAGGHISIPKVLLAVLKDPRVARSFYSLWKRSKGASRSLGSVLAGLLRLSGRDIDEIRCGGGIVRIAGQETGRPR